MLRGKGFHGTFLFDGDTMLDYHVKEIPGEAGCP
jgi:hypothetical protein